MHLAPNDSVSKAFADIAFAKFLLLAPVILVAVCFLLAFAPPQSTSHFRGMLLLSMPLAAGLNSVWFLQSQGRFLSICLLAVAGSTLTLLIGFRYVSVASHAAIEFTVLVLAFGPLFIGAGTLLLAVESIRGAIGEWNIQRSVHALADGWNLFISQFVSMLYVSTGPLVVNHLIGSRAAGAYGVTERVINALMTATLLTHTAAYPRLAAAYKADRIAYWRMLKLIILTYLGITLLLSGATWMLRESVVRFMYGETGAGDYGLLFSGLAWLVLGIFGTALTGYLTVAGRTDEIWPLTVKLLLFCAAIGVPAVLLLGSSGWFAALALSQLIVIQAGIKHWKSSYAT